MDDEFYFGPADFVRVFSDEKPEIQDVAGGVELTIGDWSSVIYGASVATVDDWLVVA